MQYFTFQAHHYNINVMFSAKTSGNLLYLVKSMIVATVGQRQLDLCAKKEH